MDAVRLRRWALRLHTIAASTLDRPENRWGRGSPRAGGALDNPGLNDFRDEQGARRATDGPLLARFFSLPPVQTPLPLAPDALIWHALHDPNLLPMLPGVLNPEPDGPLTRQPESAPLEVWTETELAALHGYFHLTHESQDPDPAALGRCFAAARWNVRNTQPDNATHHAWGTHVFIALSERDSDPDADLYAQTLLHNCQATAPGGRPDLLSAILLEDSARALDRLSSMPDRA